MTKTRAVIARLALSLAMADKSPVSCIAPPPAKKMPAKRGMFR